VARDKEKTLKTVTLNNGVEMPILGFGVFQIADPASVSGAFLTHSRWLSADRHGSVLRQ
jgi:diketogulonate reductase-like aldo/keto reductase